jgi:uncharacterized phage protein (TIGR01671 family)
MREIKFRVWDKELNIMSYDNDDLLVMFLGKDICVAYDTPADNGEIKHYELMQYIGLKDKNGKEVYEGDIVKFMDEETIYSDCGYEYNEFINTGKIIFNKELMGWDITNRNMDLEEIWHYSEYIEVIGNIYENPELLD